MLLVVSEGGWRAARPALEGVIERLWLLVTQQPRDLRQSEARLLDVLERKAVAHLVNDLVEGRPFFGEPARQVADVDSQIPGDRFRLRPSMLQELLEHVLERGVE